LDQSTPAWRVFDEPATSGPGTASAGAVGSAGRSDGVALASPNLLLAVAAIVGALLIGGVALVVAIGGSGAATVQGPETGSGSSAPESPGPPVGEIVVDVTGAVVKPGLYHLGTGARVGDALDAAGGFGPRVDVDRVGRELNLAAILADGDQVRVPSRDDPTTAPGGGGAGAGDGGGGGGSGGGGLVNLNSATQAELEELPGIGPVTAQKIIAAREEAPFRTVEELRERGLVGEKTFEDLRALVTAG
jgi:competence protein ComEA